MTAENSHLSLLHSARDSSFVREEEKNFVIQASGTKYGDSRTPRDHPPRAILGLSAGTGGHCICIVLITPIVVLFGVVLFAVFCFFCFMSSVLRYSQRNRFFDMVQSQTTV